MLEKSKQSLILVVIVVFFVQSCATTPEDVLALRPTMMDRSKDCNYYESALVNAENIEEELGNRQEDLRFDDSLHVGFGVSFGIFFPIFYLILAGVEGDSYTTARYAQVKGEIVEIREILAEKGCS